MFRPDFIGGKVTALGHLNTKYINLDLYSSAWAGIRHYRKDWGAEIGIRGRF